MLPEFFFFFFFLAHWDQMVGSAPSSSRSKLRHRVKTSFLGSLVFVFFFVHFLFVSNLQSPLNTPPSRHKPSCKSCLYSARFCPPVTLLEKGEGIRPGQGCASRREISIIVIYDIDRGRTPRTVTAIVECFSGFHDVDEEKSKKDVAVRIRSAYQ